MAAACIFAGSVPNLRRRAIHGPIRSPPVAASQAAGSKENPKVKMLSVSSFLSVPPLFDARFLRRRSPGRVLVLRAYYDDGEEGSDGGEIEEGGEGSVLPTVSGKGGMRGEEAGRRLYVGNLPYSMSPSQLTEVFSEAGCVDSVEVVYDRVTDRSRGFAFVTMGSADDARSAIRLFDGAQVGGRTVKVNFPEVPRGGEREVMGPRMREELRTFVDSPHKLYAGNLSWKTTSDSLRRAFAGCSGVLAARVAYERDTGRSRGFGFVSFVSAEDARSALDAMDGAEVDGRPLRLNMALSSAAASTTGAAALP